MNEPDPLPETVGELRTLLMEMLSDPDFCRVIHLYSDKDFSTNSQHHTIGTRHTQVKGGDQL